MLTDESAGPLCPIYTTILNCYDRNTDFCEVNKHIPGKGGVWIQPKFIAVNHCNELPLSSLLTVSMCYVVGSRLLIQ